MLLEPMPPGGRQVGQVMSKPLEPPNRSPQNLRTLTKLNQTKPSTHRLFKQEGEGEEEESQEEDEDVDEDAPEPILHDLEYFVYLGFRISGGPTFSGTFSGFRALGPSL